MAITTMDGLVAALGASQDQKLFFPSGTNAAGGWVNLNRLVTGSFGQLAAPALFSAGGTTQNQGAAAGYPKWSAAAGGQLSYIGRLGSTFATAGAVHIYDEQWSCTGFSGIVTTAQAVVGFSGLPARAGTGVGNELWVFSTTATGATASNITVQYTNSSGVAGRSTVSTAMIASMPAGRMFPVRLQSGDVGVQSVQSVTLSASTGTAGSFGVAILDRVASFGSAMANVSSVSDFAALGMPTVSDSAVLVFVHQATTTSSGIILGQMSVIQG